MMLGMVADCELRACPLRVTDGIEGTDVRIWRSHRFHLVIADAADVGAHVEEHIFGIEAGGGQGVFVAGNSMQNNEIMSEDSP